MVVEQLATAPPAVGSAMLRRIALGITGVALLGYGAAILLSARWQPGGQSYAGWEGLWLTSLLAYAVVGGLVCWHRPGNPVGWLCLLGGAAAMVAAALDVVAAQALLNDPGSIPEALWLRWGQAVLFSVSLTMLPALPLLLFPDGRLPSRRWRPVLWLGGLMVVGSTVMAAFAPGPLGEQVPGDNPLGVSVPWLFDVIDAVLWPAVSVLTLVVMVSLVIRWRGAAGETRRRLAWLALAALVAMVAWAVESLLGWAGVDGAVLGSGVLAAPVLFGVPAAIGIGMLQHRLFDIEAALTRALAYAVLSGLVLLAYVGSVLVASQYLRASADVAVSLIATALLAVALSPVKDRLVRRIDRWLFGERQHPYVLLASLAGRVDDVARPEHRLADLAEVIRAGLRLPFVAVEVDTGPESAVYQSGERRAVRVLSLPLVVEGRQLGRLVAGQRPGEELSAGQGAVLADLARQVAMAVHSIGLAGELQRSRERLVIAREEERRRVRRDLHDGIGPVLAALTLQVDALRHRLPHDDAEGRELAIRMKVELQHTVGEVRRVVEGLRPPSLDQLGLAGAVAAHARAVSGERLRVEVSIAAGMALSPAVEVAAYRILTEAITNVARHAHATICHVMAQPGGGGLVLTVRDDGRGLDGSGGGVGLTTMRERASELGGTFEVRGGPEGVTMRAWLPLGQL